MFTPRLTLGPPGCGKTEELLRHFTEALQRGVAPERIALVTFTRAARQEAKDRALRQFAFGEKRFAWLRTIHSGAFRLLGLTHTQILDEERLGAFAKRYGYELTIKGYELDDDPLEPVCGRKRDDVLLFVYGWGRSCRFDLEQTIARCPVEGFSVPQLRLFVRRLQEFKHEHGLFDFSDLLDEVLARGLRPDVDVAMVDEAHDLSPLQIAVVERWFDGCADVLICADDDQAIFKWQGASPGWIRALAERCPTKVLSESHRVPIVVHALAQRVIAGVKDRRPKAYKPKNDLGRVLVCDLDQALQLVQASNDAFVLVRNRMFIGRVASELVEAVGPFTVEGWGGRSPLSDERALNAVKCAIALAGAESGPFPTTQVRALVSYIPNGSDWIGPNAREHIKARHGQGSYTYDALVNELGFGPLLDRLVEDGPFVGLPRMKRDDRRYFERLLARYGALPEPTTVVTTIHVAKGRQAKLVVIIPDMTRSTYQEYIGRGQAGHDEEARVFYVGVTRAQDTLVLVQPRSHRHFVFPKANAQEGVL